MVVSNTSPISCLALIGHIRLLQDLYGRVLVPEAVRQELARAPSALPVSALVRSCTWIETRAVSDRQFVEALQARLHRGESEAVALAREVNADILLLDEHRGRKIAEACGLNCVGSVGVLVEARKRGLVPSVRPLIDALISQAGFWLSPEVYEQVIAQLGES